MKLISYVPHGAVPDVRGFSPALAAANIVKHLRFFSPVTVCGNELYPPGLVADAQLGAIFRIEEGSIYRRVFRKLAGLDPHPMHARAARFINRYGADIFHAHQLEFPVNDFLRRLRRPVPVVIHAHAVRTFDPRRGVAEKYIAVSQYTKDNLLKLGYPAARLAVVYNGVDTALFSPASLDEKVKLKALLRLAADAVVLGYIGRKSAAKGYLIFLRTAKRLLADFPRLCIVAAGPTPPDAGQEAEFSSIESEAAALHATGRFIEFPALPHRHLANVYRVMDIFLAPTYFGGEQHPLAVCEALASGCIAVVSDHAGIRETIADNVTGILLPDPRHEQAVTEKVGQIIADIDSFQQLRQSARHFAVNHFDWSIAAGKLEEIYLGILRH